MKPAREFHARQRLMKLDDTYISYIDEGQGPPVVLLHGIPTWGYLWRDLIPMLSGRYRVLVPDMLGFGYSDKRDRFDRSIARQTTMLDRFLERLDAGPASIVGHDIGGGVAQRLAVFHPSRLKAMALLNSVSFDSWPTETMIQLGHPDTRRRLSAAALHIMLRQALKMGFAHTPSDEEITGLLWPYRTEVGKLSLIRAAAALNTNLTTEISERLCRIDIPTLLLWGEDDRFQPVRHASRLQCEIPHARLEIISGARHFAMIDQPQAVAGSLSAFLSEIG